MDVKAAFIIVIILQFLDISFTFKILSMYRKYNPEDKDWADLEFNKTARLIFKKFGLGKKSFILNIITTSFYMTLIFGLVYILNFDMQFFVYAAFGGLAFLNVSHYEHYKRLKEKLRDASNEANNDIINKEEK